MEKKKNNFAKLQHVGVVVKDIKKAITYLESLGIGPFMAPGVEPGKPPVFTIPFKGELHGKPAEWTVKISNTRVGESELELLQPSGGESALQEFLDNNGEGVHHIAYLVDDVKGELEKLKKLGVKVITSANLDTRGFAYIETGVGGIVIEIRFR